MLNIELDEEAGIAILTPKGELSENDFKTAARIVARVVKKLIRLDISTT